VSFNLEDALDIFALIVSKGKVETPKSVLSTYYLTNYKYDYAANTLCTHSPSSCLMTPTSDIQINVKGVSIVPPFTPKTDNDTSAS
jgi:hypothetical protein